MLRKLKSSCTALSTGTEVAYVFFFKCMMNDVRFMMNDIRIVQGPELITAALSPNVLSCQAYRPLRIPDELMRDENPCEGLVNESFWGEDINLQNWPCATCYSY